MKRIYYNYKYWEDWKLGFYDNCSGNVKKEKIKKVIELFNNEDLTIKYMQKVIKEWKYSCEHNFSNPSLNKIAYLGQAACCLYSNIPNTVTMEAWSFLDKKIQLRSDKIAKGIINKWIKKYEKIKIR